LNNPHLRERGMVTEIEHPTRGKVAVLGSPIKLSKSEIKIQPAPLLGQHTREILGSMLNLSDADIAKLKEEKVIS